MTLSVNETYINGRDVRYEDGLYDRNLNVLGIGVRTIKCVIPKTSVP